MNREEISILKTVYQLMQKIESLAVDPIQAEAELFQITGLLKSLETSQDLMIQKLALIPDHFYPKMPLAFFTTWIVPVERALNRNLSDDQFLITTADRTQNKSSIAKKIPLSLALDNLRSSFNVGSIFRLADCVGVEEIFLTGYTALPTENEALQKTSMGTFETQKWSSQKKLNHLLQQKKSQGCLIYALETAENAAPLYSFSFPKKESLFLVGNERFGIEAETLKACDHVLQIPTFGIKNSLNVSNAMAIACYEFRRQWDLECK